MQKGFKKATVILRLYNTATRRVEDFSPLDPSCIKMYTCGLTVYYYTHIGNLRAYTNSDILRRTLEYMGLQVKHVMNITDVGHMTSDEDAGEDKLEVGAKREGKSPWEIARFYEAYFSQSIEKLNILRPYIKCRATEHIKDMIELIVRLERRGLVYRTRVGVIFDTSKFSGYAKFAGLDLEGQQHGARVEVDPERKNPWDFALWVTNQPNHIMQWASPWGRGFPGWHVECSAMSMKYLGEEIDIHTGGIDHVRVHHTNEIAQSEGATGKRFVRYWFHSHFMNVDRQKMSKSSGNLYTLDDITSYGFSPLALRYFFLGSSYRKSTNFTWQALGAAQASLVRLWEKAVSLPFFSHECLPEYIASFNDALMDDLNTARALAVVIETANTSAPAEKIAGTLLTMDRVLGLDLANGTHRLNELKELQVSSSANEQKALALVHKRDNLRQQKKYAEADAVRDEVIALGFVVEDAPEGTRLKPKGPKK